ncbi:MAG TPA: ABC transporter substrate-binding protein [Gammaproteobacteria bacterium]|nr:ABC transporter substrate-binding protein [Gammaproteobacteria bacterium]
MIRERGILAPPWQSVFQHSAKFLAVAILALGLAVAARAAPAPGDPTTVVQQASTDIIGALNKNADKLKSDPALAGQLVKQYLLPHFDFDFTCQLVLGRYWRTATPAQRSEFQKVFLQYLTTTYAKGLQNFNGAHVNVLPFRGDASQQYVKVRTQVQTAGHAPIEVDYALRQTAQGWKAFDVIIAGVSYVQTYQNEFQSEIQRTSLPSLIARLQKAQAPAAASGAPAAASGG